MYTSSWQKNISFLFTILCSTFFLWIVSLHTAHAVPLEKKMHWPVKGKISAPFSQESPIFGSHAGIDIVVSQGTKVTAAAKGKVVHVQRPKSTTVSYVTIKHGKKIETMYLHLSKIRVKKGDRVKKGAVIGLSGGEVGTKGSGNTTGPHLHFAVNKEGIFVNPMRYLR